MTNNALLARGGSESYLETVAVELRRLGHQVQFYSPLLGEVAQRLRSQGFTVYDVAADLPRDVDVIHGQHSNAVAKVRERLPTTPLVFATHSFFISVEDPVLELAASAYVAFNDITHRRLLAHVATQDAPVVRLTQPVDVSFADGARTTIRSAPRRAVAISRRMTTIAVRLERACAERGLAFVWVGGEQHESPDPRPDMLVADIVFAVGRTALEAMAAARAVLVVDESTVGGWVSTSSYAGLEADGFTGLGTGLGGGPAQLADVSDLLDGYAPDLGSQARRLVTRHHAVQHHAVALVDLYTSVAGQTRSASDAGTVGLLVQDRFALESRAVTAEWDAARLRAEVEDLGGRLEAARADGEALRAELEGRLLEREHLLARVEGLGDRLRRARGRARRFRRERDQARTELATARHHPWTRLAALRRRATTRAG